MKKIKILFLVLLISCASFGCAPQQVTRNLGGDSTIELPKGKRLVPYTVQWETKGADLWYLVEDMPEGYEPKTYEFIESSNYGVLQGKIIFIESRK